MSIYGLLISFSILICTLLLQFFVKKDGKNEDFVWGLLSATIVPAIIGARIYHVISEWNYYQIFPTHIFWTWNGGLALWGGLIGGLFGAYIYLKNKREDLAYWLDRIALVLPIGQAIGRWANYFNQELYGKPTTLPWAIYIEPEKRLPGLENFNTFHPLFIYESILNIILFICLGLISRKHKPGTKQVFYSYLIGYSSIRFILEFLRPLSWTIYGLNVSQAICIIVFITAVILKRKHL